MCLHLLNRVILPCSALKSNKKQVSQGLTWQKDVLNFAQLCKTTGKHTNLMMLFFPCVLVSTTFVWCLSHSLSLASLIPPCGTLKRNFACFFFSLDCEIDQTQKQVMIMSVWSCSAWRRWQTCNPCRTSTAPLWRGARRLWRKQTSTSEWKSLLQGLFVNFLTACAFVLYAFALRLQGFS